MADKAEKPYNPFAEVVSDENDDMSILFGNTGPKKKEEEQSKKEDSDKKGDDNEYKDIFANLPAESRGPVAKLFLSLQSKLEEANKSSSSSDTVLEKIGPALEMLAANKEKPKDRSSILDTEAEEAAEGVGEMFKKLGIEDASQVSSLVKLIDVISEKRARNLYDPLVKHYMNSTAKGERAAIADKYSPSEGYPSLAECAKGLQSLCDLHPTLSLSEAYEMHNSDRISEIKFSKKGKEKVEKKEVGTEDLKEFLRKMSVSGDLPNNTDSNRATRTGPMTIEDAFDDAVKEFSNK